MKTEWKIGEVFEHNGEWYQCIPDTTDDNCNNCFFQKNCSNITGDCSSTARSDGKTIAFKKLEKAGEPIEFARGLYFQRYRLAYLTAFYEGDTRLFFNAPTNTFIYIEIKQTKEDMEEGKIQHYDCFFDKEQSKSNLKPFSLELAKQGKPVCTKNGKKARIICFDAKGVLPIIALVESGDEEKTVRYSNSGRFRFDRMPDEEDLIMLSEKKEGWINVYRDCDGVNITKDDNIYSSKDAAIASAQMVDRDNYVATAKIQWEE